MSVLRPYVSHYARLINCPFDIDICVAQRWVIARLAVIVA